MIERVLSRYSSPVRYFLAIALAAASPTPTPSDAAPPPPPAVQDSNLESIKRVFSSRVHGKHRSPFIYFVTYFAAIAVAAASPTPRSAVQEVISSLKSRNMCSGLKSPLVFARFDLHSQNSLSLPLLLNFFTISSAPSGYILIASQLALERKFSRIRFALYFFLKAYKAHRDTSRDSNQIVICRYINQIVICRIL